jgi:hypothetical protein
MQLIPVSDTRGFNLAHVVEWHDSPDIPEPVLILTMVAASQNTYGQRQPYEIRLSGHERLTALTWLGQLAAAPAGEDWQAAYEDARAECQRLTRRLHAFEAEVTEAEGRRIWERIHAEERTP